jgi:hypothetical protein
MMSMHAPPTYGTAAFVLLVLASACDARGRRARICRARATQIPAAVVVGELEPARQ